MMRPRFPDRQIAFELQQAEQGTQVVEVTRKMGISEQTFYRWKKKLGGLMPSEVRKLRQLEEEKPGFTEKIEAWPGHYNEQRPHSSL